MNTKAFFLERVRSISKYRLLIEKNSAITIMCYYQRGASCLMNLRRVILRRFIWARFLGRVLIGTRLFCTRTTYTRFVMPA